jgi:mono/diheme cytochrome c family protein
MNRILKVMLLFVVVLAAVYCSGPQIKTETTSTNDSAGKLVYLDQGWSAEDRADFYWAPQGSALMSYDIYMTLKDPETGAYINSPEITDAFGFLREQDHAKNPDNFPIGVAKSVVKDGPFKGEYIGLTCAACHTNQISYEGTNIRIDGGNTTSFLIVPWLKKLTSSLENVQKDKTAFKELVAEISKKGKVDETDLRKRLNEDVEIANSWITKILYSKTENGPGRMDAFGGIANAFLGIHAGIMNNITVNEAPVKPPFLWNASQSAWVQWSGVSPNPISRNYSEALGVFSRYDVSATADPNNYVVTTVDIRQLAHIEKLLRRLAPPQWPQEILGKIDSVKAARGAKLFTSNCASCHSIYPHRWSEPRENGIRMIENALVPLKIIGTDPANLKSIALDTTAVVTTKHLKVFFGGKEKVTPSEFFKIAEGAMMQYSINKAGLTEEEILDANGYLTMEMMAKDKIPFGVYKAAPRDGAWSIGPYLHNGSVPNLFELLSPAKERSESFYVNSQFDPVKVGINTNQKSGFKFDTKLAGNSNAGHSFEDTKGPGVIGKKFTETERYEIIEFLKSIPTQPGQVTPYGGPANPILAKDDKTWFNNWKPY